MLLGVGIWQQIYFLCRCLVGSCWYLLPCLCPGSFLFAGVGVGDFRMIGAGFLKDPKQSTQAMPKRIQGGNCAALCERYTLDPTGLTQLEPCHMAFLLRLTPAVMPCQTVFRHCFAIPSFWWTPQCLDCINEAFFSLLQVLEISLFNVVRILMLMYHYIPLVKHPFATPCHFAVNNSICINFR